MTTTDNASQVYEREGDALLAHLDRIRALVTRHRRNHLDHPDNWAFVGDVTHWNELLARVGDNVEVEDAADPFAGIVDVETNDGWDV